VGLDGASLDLYPGEKVALLGPNGCGKTTFLLHLCGVLRPQEGEVRLDGRPVAYSREGLRTLRQAVGTVLQDADEQLFAASVYEDVSFGPLNFGLSESEVRQRVDQALGALGIRDLADRPPHRLSLGQKKRVALAGVVALKPRVIVLDEPTAGLDPRGVAALMEVLDDLSRDGTQVTFITHDVDLAYGWADRVALLNAGRIVAAGLPDEVFRRTDLIGPALLRGPWQVDVFDALRAAGLKCGSEPPPRSMASFLKWLAGVSRSTEGPSAE
jgi:cobalt/nickel transport system ATP-binding protein